MAFIEIKIAGLYKKYCWDMITIMVILGSMAIAIYFGDWIKEVLPINLLFLLLFVQPVYVGIRWYVGDGGKTEVVFKKKNCLRRSEVNKMSSIIRSQQCVNKLLASFFMIDTVTLRECAG